MWMYFKVAGGDEKKDIDKRIFNLVMFNQANLQIRESLYGIWAKTLQKKTIHHSYGSGFMIAPNYIITTAHVLHV
jgi:hypothetical protein